MSVLLAICAYLDIQGFAHKKFSAVREVAWLTTDSPIPLNFQVHPGCLPLHDDEARKSLNFNKYKLHGLDFFPGIQNHFIEQDDVSSVINQLYDSARSVGCYLVAYKGGIMEKNILNDLGIPSVDLDRLVPKFQTWPDVKNYRKFTCGNHVHRELGWQFCSSCKVMFYRNYVTML